MTYSPETHMSVTCSFSGSLQRCFPLTEYRWRKFLSCRQTAVEESLLMTMQLIMWFIVDENAVRDLERGLAHHAGVHKQVTLP